MLPYIPLVSIEAYCMPGTVPGTVRIPGSDGHSPVFSDLTITWEGNTPPVTHMDMHTAEPLCKHSHLLRVQGNVLTLAYTPVHMHMEAQSLTQM